MSNEPVHQSKLPHALSSAKTNRALLAYWRHELRTPLNAILGYSEMLNEDALAEGWPEFAADLGKIRTAGQLLLTQVNDILDPERIAAQPRVDLDAYRALLQHNLRTPLNAVIGYSELWLDEAAIQAQPAFKTDLENIRAAGHKLLTMVDEVALLPPLATDEPHLPAPATTQFTHLQANNQAATTATNMTPSTMCGTLLVVDDDVANRDLLSRWLQRQGHQVTVAENGRQALARMRDQLPDLVLLDLLMPDMSGDQVLAQMKADPTLRALPVLMISALDEIKSVVHCIELGAEDYLPKPFDPVLLRARVGACLEKKRLRDREVAYLNELQKLNQDLAIRNQFIRQTFGRYLSDELVESILETPGGLQLGGETRQATILMADLRGFSSLAERLTPEQVVTLLNIFLGTMADIILSYQGVIDEFIGDAILAIFGAPLGRADDAERAVACALAMQLGMAMVNEQNRALGLPEVAMGVALNTGTVVAGNIGSFKRTKYGVIGSAVNLTARIESYTVGGQLLVSETTLAAVTEIARVDSQMTIAPKGVTEPLTVYEIGGLAGAHQLFLPPRADSLMPLAKPLPLRFYVLEGKQTGALVYEGAMIALAPTRAEIHTAKPVTVFSNLKLRLLNPQGEFIPGDLYGKVLTLTPTGFLLSFTSIPPELMDVLHSPAR